MTLITIPVFNVVRVFKESVTLSVLDPVAGHLRSLRLAGPPDWASSEV